MRALVSHPWKSMVRLVLGLTRPDDSVPQRERRSARLLAAMLMALAGIGLTLGLGGSLVIDGQSALEDDDFLITAGLVIALLFGWRYSRTYHYRRVAALIVLVLDLGLLGISLPISDSDDLKLQVYLIVPVLLCSMWFSWRWTAALAGFNVLVLLPVPFVFEGVTAGDLWIGYLVGVSSLVILVAHQLGQIDQARQTELIEARERYRRLIEYAPVTIAVMQEGRVVYVNPAGVRLLGGHSMDEVIGLTVDRIVAPDDLATAEQRIGLVMQGENMPPMQHKIVRLDGTSIEVESVIIPFVYEQQPAIQIVAYDVTERQTAEDALRRSEARQRALLRALPDLLFCFNRAGIVVDVQAEGKEDVLVGDAHTIIGRKVEDELPEAYAQRLRAAIERALDTGTMQVLEYQLDFSGHTRDFEGRAVVSAPDEVLYIVRDITERKATENALRASEEQNRAVLAAIPDLMLQFDRQGTIVNVKSNWAEGRLSASPEEILGTPIGDLVSAHARQDFLARIEKALAGEMQVWEYPLHLPDGEYFFEVRMVASGPEHVLAVVRDITERRHMDEALRRRDAILDALADMSERLVRADDLDSALRESIKALGEATAMSYSFLCANHPGPQGKMVSSLRHWWTSSKQPVERSRYRNLPLFLTEDSWGTRLAAGQPVYGVLREMSGSARDLLLEVDALSVALMPIFVENEWWGFWGLVDCERERRWLPVEIEALRSASNALGAAILRERTQSAEREQRALAEALRDVATTLTSTLDPALVIDRLLVMLGRVVPHDAANIMIINHEAQLARVIGFRGYSGRGLDDYMRQVVISLDDPYYMLRERMEQDEALIVSDVTTASWWHEFPETKWIRSFASAPIRIQGQTVGMLNLDSATPGFFGPQHAGRLKAFADQAAIALRNAQLYAAEREQRTLAETLRETLTAINRTLDPDTVLDLILANIERVVPHDAANVMLIEGNQVRVARARGYEAYGTTEWMYRQEIPLNAWPSLVRMLEAGQPTCIGDTLVDPDWVEMPETAWIRSVLSCPIRIGERTIGLIVLDGAQPHTFSDKQSEVLQMFAEQAAVALNNAHLYDEVRRSVDELAVLYRGTSFLFSALPAVTTMSDLSNQIVQTVVGTFKRVACGLLLLDPETGNLHTISRAGDYEIQSPHALQLDGPGLVASAVRTGEPVYAPDVRLDDRYIVGDPRTASELVIPLKSSGGESIGALDLQSIELDAFTAQDRHVLNVFAERVAAAIENRQLYAQIQRHADQMERRVNERTADLSVRNAVAETLSSSLDTGAMLDGVLATLVEHLGITGGAIFLLDASSQSLSVAAQRGLTQSMLDGMISLTPNTLVQDGSPPSPPELAREIGIAAMLDVPIWRQGQIMGVITLVHDQPRIWGNEEMRMVDAIGRQVGVALANAQLYAEAVHSSARIGAILQSAADGILVFDQVQTPIVINPAGEALFRFYPAERGGAQRAASLLWDWLQRRIARLGSPESVEFSLPIEALVNPATGLPMECIEGDCPYASREDLYWPCWLIDADGANDRHEVCSVIQRIPRRAIQARSAIIHDPAGEVTGTVIVLHDVTYYRELDDLKGRFVSTVSHELRTPLSAILLEISSLAKYYDRFDDGERLRIVRQIYGQANVLRELVEDILELSRFDARRARPNKEWFDLAAHSRDLIQSMLAVTRERDLVIDATGLAGVQYVYGDSAQLMRSLRNLFGNAVKYTPDGGIVQVGLTRDGDSVRLWVKDTGIGIPPEEQVYVFDPFFRTEEAAKIASGTGLGLAITREIVELHDGRIDVESAPGRGSTFTITLPVPAPGELDRDL